MNRIRTWFDARWPRLEVYGLRVTGAYIFTLGAIVIPVGMDVDPLFPALGAVLILAGLLTIDRSREDLVTWIVAGLATAALVFAVAVGAAPEGTAAVGGVDWLLVLVIFGSALFGLRAFRGAFRRNRSPTVVYGADE